MDRNWKVEQSLFAICYKDQIYTPEIHKTLIEWEHRHVSYTQLARAKKRVYFTRGDAEKGWKQLKRQFLNFSIIEPDLKIIEFRAQ